MFVSFIGLTMSETDKEPRSIWAYEREKLWFNRMLNENFDEHWKNDFRNDSKYFSGNYQNFSTRYGKERLELERLAFGILKGRWRCLLKRVDNRIENVSAIIIT